MEKPYQTVFDDTFRTLSVKLMNMFSSVYVKDVRLLPVSLKLWQVRTR